MHVFLSELFKNKLLGVFDYLYINIESLSTLLFVPLFSATLRIQQRNHTFGVVCVKPLPDIFSFCSFLEDEPVLSEYQIFFSVIKRYVGKTLPEILYQIICIHIGLYGFTVLVVDDHEYIADLTEWYDPPDCYLDAVIDRTAFFPDTLRICTCWLILHEFEDTYCVLAIPRIYRMESETTSLFKNFLTVFTHNIFSFRHLVVSNMEN